MQLKQIKQSALYCRQWWHLQYWSNLSNTGPTKHIYSHFQTFQLCWHFAIAGPWALTLDQEMLYSGPRLGNTFQFNGHFAMEMGLDLLSTHSNSMNIVSIQEGGISVKVGHLAFCTCLTNFDMTIQSGSGVNPEVPWVWWTAGQKQHFSEPVILPL